MCTKEKKVEGALSETKLKNNGGRPGKKEQEIKTVIFAEVVKKQIQCTGKDKRYSDPSD